jgi:hypothetical protein
MAPPDPARPRPPYRFIGTLALFGAALLTGGTVLHPAHADPGSPTAAFAEYADAGRGTWSTNPLERINKEIKRRSRVVGTIRRKGHPITSGTGGSESFRARP